MRRKRMHGKRRSPFRFNLNPPADKILTEAATEESYANVPHDYKEDFDQVAKGYSKGVTAIGKAISKAISGE